MEETGGLVHRFGFSEVALGEDVTAAGFEINLEGASQFFRLKGDIGLNFPRSELCRVGNGSGIMPRQAFA